MDQWKKFDKNDMPEIGRAILVGKHSLGGMWQFAHSAHSSVIPYSYYTIDWGMTHWAYLPEWIITGPVDE